MVIIFRLTTLPGVILYATVATIVAVAVFQVGGTADLLEFVEQVAFVIVTEGGAAAAVGDLTQLALAVRAVVIRVGGGQAVVPAFGLFRRINRV